MKSLKIKGIALLFMLPVSALACGEQTETASDHGKFIFNSCIYKLTDDGKMKVWITRKPIRPIISKGREITSSIDSVSIDCRQQFYKVEISHYHHQSDFSHSVSGDKFYQDPIPGSVVWSIVSKFCYQLEIDQMKASK